MSWHFSQELEADCLAAGCWDGGRFVPSKWMSILEASSSSGSRAETSIHSRSGMMSRPSTGSRGGDTSISSPADFHVRTFLSPERVAALVVPDPGSGRKWRELLGRYSPDTCTLRTARCLLEEDLMKSSRTLPRWGMMLSGELWELFAPKRCTPVKGSGYWRTPDAGAGGGISEEKARTLKRDSGHDVQVRLMDQVAHPHLRPKYPTPTRSAANQSYRTEYTGGGLRLDEFVIAKYPTPTATAYNGWSPGRLNPDWVEWLMGWPVGWTDVERDTVDTSWDWDTDPADTGDIPPVTERTHLRAKRIMAIGNGQVPQAMVFGFKVLSGVFERINHPTPLP